MNKYPYSTKYGRQNPITARWNSEERLVAWRASWADAVNRSLERSGIEDRIDHRSHAERGLDEKPTIHEGVSARKMEKAGFASERCETNRQIRTDNAVIRAMKAAIVKLKKIIETTIPAIAAAMETIRQNIIAFNYGLLFIRDRRKEAREYGVLYNHVIDRERSTTGTVYMYIHIVLVIALNNITVALEFMREPEVNARAKSLFLVASFLIYYLSLFFLNRYAHEPFRAGAGEFLRLLALGAVFAAAMLLALRNAWVNIAISAAFVYAVLSVIVWHWKTAEKQGE